MQMRYRLRTFVVITCTIVVRITQKQEEERERRQGKASSVTTDLPPFLSFAFYAQFAKESPISVLF